MQTDKNTEMCRTLLFMQSSTSLLRLVELQHSAKIFLQGSNVFRQCLPPSLGQPTRRARLLAHNLLTHLDITRRGKLVYLNAEIARRGLRMLLQITEIGFFHRQQQRNNGKTELGVQQRVQLFYNHFTLFLATCTGITMNTRNEAPNNKFQSLTGDATSI